MNRHFDFGRLAVALALIILLIFGVDFIRRSLLQLFHKQPDIQLEGNNSSFLDTVDSVTDSVQTGDATEPAGTDDSSSAGSYDTERYTTVSKPYTEVGAGPLILVNQEHPYTGSGSDLSSFSGTKNDSFRLKNFGLMVNSDLLTPQNDMFAAFSQATGLKNVMLYSTHENYAGGMYDTDIPERKTGYCVDMSLLKDDGIGRFTGTDKYSWIVSNCAQYGFVQRYPADKKSKTGVEENTWHFRFVGAPHAALMKQNNLCLEEYLEWIRDYTPSGNPAAITVNGTYYEVYYVPAVQGNTTEVPVPKSDSYTVSGDNIGGFVVTVQATIGGSGN